MFLVVAGFFALSWTGLLRHWNLGSYHFDLGNMHQAVFNTSRGRFLEMTDPNLFFQSHRLAYHFDPILAFFAPFYWIYSGAEMLIIGQALVLALGAIPVYYIARDVLKKPIVAILFALIYLSYYPMHFTQIADFHAVTLSTTFLLFMFYFAEKRAFALSWAFIVLAWLTKENASLIIAFFGLYHVFFRKNKIFGWTVFVLSSTAFILIMKFIIPSFRTTDMHFASGYYTTDITENVSRIIRPAAFRYVASLLAPVGFVSLLSPVHLLISLPEWMINLLSSNNNMRLLQYHYSAQLTPFIIISAMYGTKKIAKLLKQSLSVKNPAIVISFLILMISLIFAYMKSPLIRSRYKIQKEELNVVRLWQEKLSDDKIRVSASGHLSPYFSGRKYFYNFFFDFAYGAQGQTDEEIAQLADHYTKADYVLIKRSEINDHQMVQYYYNHLISNPQYEKIFDENGIEVYQLQYYAKQMYP